ncbi:MAG: extensin family protein [Methyloceanibacter sp.]|jgi:hypothetical protein|nr:extensin family protein [Methyloceanibacter sp.]
MMPNPIAWFTFALLVGFPVYALAETDEVPPLPDRNPAHVEGPVAKAPVLPGDQPTVPWTDEEIASAKAECATALANLALDYEPLPPIKEGICGAPAPILVKSIGSDPKVVIDPPATVTCPLASGLSAWLSKTVQPEAKALLGSQVVKLHNATSYACRNRYGSATTPLSEHALANALDVSEFFLASGEHITVLDGWPRLAKAPSPPAQSPIPSPATTGSIATVSHTTQPAPGVVEVTKVKVIKIEMSNAKINPFAVSAETNPVGAKTNPFVLVAAPPAARPPAPPPEAKSPAPSPDAASPKPDATSPEPQSLSEREGVFVKTVHDDACHTFGTVLGPEANEAHKNHFHLDMKARRRTAFCE